MDIPTSEVRWTPCYRIIPSRFPPISLFEAVADPADLEAVYAIEAMTNDRLRDEAGELSLVPPEDRVSGPGTSAIMAAFTHLNPVGDRFTDGSYGVFYAGLTLATIRGQREALPALYHPSSYAVSQETARTLRDAGSDGIVYESVRNPGGECAAVFRPRLLSNCRQERHLCYVWDGSEIRTVYEKRLLDS